MKTGSQEGFSLLEVLVAMFLLALGVLGLAPMFVLALDGNAAGAEMGSVNAIGVEVMERLRSRPYDTVVPGGSLSSDEAGFSDVTNPEYVIRWTVADNVNPVDTKTITVRVTARLELNGAPREVTLMTLRARSDH